MVSIRGVYSNERSGRKKRNRHAGSRHSHGRREDVSRCGVHFTLAVDIWTKFVKCAVLPLENLILLFAAGVCKDMVRGQANKLDSAFHLTYNMVLNLLRVEEINPEFMLERSFFQVKSNAECFGLT